MSTFQFQGIARKLISAAVYARNTNRIRRCLIFLVAHIWHAVVISIRLRETEILIYGKENPGKEKLTATTSAVSEKQVS